MKKQTNNTHFEAFFESVYKLVLQIPHGKVMSYGQIARLLGGKYSPLAVGWALHACPQDERRIPWHRVVNSKGGISTRKILIGPPDIQQSLLESEGINFNSEGRLEMDKHQWNPSIT